jgi:hypothetical protein
MPAPSKPADTPDESAGIDPARPITAKLYDRGTFITQKVITFPELTDTLYYCSHDGICVQEMIDNDVLSASSVGSTQADPTQTFRLNYVINAFRQLAYYHRQH